MSSILEALKKLDRERTERKNGVINIEREILKAPSPEGGGKKRYSILLLAFAGTTAFLLLLLFFWVGPFGGKDSLKGKESVRHKVPAPDAARTGRLPMPQPLGQIPVAERKAVPPAPDEKSIVSQIPQKRVETAPVARSTQATTKPAPVVATPPAKKASVGSAVPQAPPPRKAPATVSQRLPSLAVSGIAFGASRKSRLAIINDQTLSIGESIEGAKVEDISEVAVRFSWQGRKFTLGIGESTRDR